MNDLLDAGVRAIVSAVHAGDADPLEIAEAAVKRAEAAPDGALVVVAEEVAVRAARRLHDRLASGERPPLAGVPVAHKDLFNTADMPTAYGNPALRRQPDRDATAVARTVQAGVIQVGKANLHEVAYGVTGVNEHTGTPVNPLDAERIPGGSSSGSGAAVAAGTVTVSLGTDTGGSVRIPAACCGVVGLKTTLGAVPTTGIQPLSPPQDSVGPIARTVEDAGLLLAVVAGPDGEDPIAGQPPAGWDPGQVLPASRLTLLRPTEAWEGRVHPDVVTTLDHVLDSLAADGAEVREVDLPGYWQARRDQATVLAANALAVHEEIFRERPDVFGEHIRARFDESQAISALDLARAIQGGRRWSAAIGRLLGNDALVVTPTLAFPTPKLGETHVSWPDGEEEITPALTRLTGIWNIAGLPAISVPAGRLADGLPVSLQIVGPPWSEPRLLAAAARVEAMAR